MGNSSVVVGGANNFASGVNSAVLGGSQNQATGNYSFALGQKARAEHEGSIVFSVPSSTEISSSAGHQFLVRAYGGFKFFSNEEATTGVELVPGAGSWAMASDRDLKESFTPVDHRTILDGIRSLPMTTWSYRAEEGDVRHLGPVAQDFYATFRLGSSDRTISTVDGLGVALAAIQGLQQELEAREERIRSLEIRLDEILRRLGSGSETP